MTEPALVEPQRQVAEWLLESARQRRSWAASFEPVLRYETKAAGCGVLAGLARMGQGGLEGNRRMIAVGAAEAAAAAALATMPNPVARLWRRQGERQVADGERVSQTMATGLRRLLAAVPPIDSAAGDG